MYRTPDEQSPLLQDRGTNDEPSTNDYKNANLKRSWWLKFINPRLTKRPWRLFEILDFHFIPGFIRRRCQAILTAAWTHRVPVLQRVSPAELAANVILQTLEKMGDLDRSKISVIDFCSGAGGPIPMIERLVNEKRASQGKASIPFVLSDLHTNVDSWMEASAKSKGNLSFIPQSVDATDPPVSATSAQSQVSQGSDSFHSDTRVMRLYCLSFHHFNDEMARKVLESTMDTADAFAIFELQDRFLSSMVLMFGHIPLIYLTTLFRYWRDPLMLFLVYVLPVVPLVNTFDGLVSCLRTRNFREVMSLIGAKEKGTEIGGNAPKLAETSGWIFQSTYEMHSYPVGYMSWITGRRKEPSTNTAS